MNLTEGEIKENFKTEYIHIDNILNILNDNLKTCTGSNAVKDTINVLEEFIKIYK